MVLETSTPETDLGVTINNQLSFSDHIQQAIGSANRLLGVIRRSYQSLLYLYKGLVRPKLEYGVAIWAPYLQQDIYAIEAVQRRGTRMIISLKDLPYEEHIRRLRLPSLVYRRLRGDMSNADKYVHGIYKVSANYIEHSNFNKIRGHQLKLKKKNKKQKNAGAASFASSLLLHMGCGPVEFTT